MHAETESNHGLHAPPLVGVPRNKAQGLNITSEELRKFITPAPSARDSRNMLRLEILGSESSNKKDVEQQPLDESEPAAAAAAAAAAVATEEQEQEQEQDEPETTAAPPSIWAAAKQGNVAGVKAAIEREGKEIVNRRDPETETTLLYTAVAHVRQPEALVRLLLEHGAEPDAPSVYGICALHALPIHCGRPLPSMQLLLEHHADINARDGDQWTPLHYAARFCKEPDAIVRHLVARGANVNAVDASNKSPLFALLANGDHASTLGWLIHSAKANVSIKGEFLLFRPTPGTLLLQAAKYARLECLKLLVQSAAAMDHLRTAVTCHELNLATVMLRKRLEKQDPSAAVHTDELLEIVEELRRMLEEDANSTVAYELYMDRTGRHHPLRRKPSLLRTLTRSRSSAAAMARSPSSPPAGNHHTAPVTRRPPLVKRMVSSVLNRQKGQQQQQQQQQP